MPSLETGAVVTAAAALLFVAHRRRRRALLEPWHDRMSLLSFAPPVHIMQDLAVRPGDVFVCSWPKSGTTWMQAIVAHLLRPDLGSWGHLSEVTPFFDHSASWDLASGSPSAAILATFEAGGTGRRAWNTHLRWSMMPGVAKGSGARFIYVIRDGRDAVVSFFYHLANMIVPGGDPVYKGTVGEFVAEVLSGEVGYGSWAAHIRDWERAFEDERVLVVRFEEMKADLEGVVRKVAAHLAQGGAATPDASIKEAAERLTFRGMKADAARYEPISVEWAPGYHFLRGGRTGDSRKELTAAERATFAVHAEKLMGRELYARFCNLE